MTRDRVPNEAAERLLERVKAATGIGGPWSDKSNWDRLLDAALATERRLAKQDTVERIRAAVDIADADLAAILDEVAGEGS